MSYNLKIYNLSMTPQYFKDIQFVNETSMIDNKTGGNVIEPFYIVQLFIKYKVFKNDPLI